MARLKRIISDPILQTADTEAKREQLLELLKWEKTRVIVAFSGGKDSIAMVLHLLFTLRVPASRIELWHHRVDGEGAAFFDWQCTDSYCQAFADHFGLKLLFSYRQGGIEREIYRRNEGRQDVFFQEEPGGKYYRSRALKGEKYNRTRLKFPAVSADLKVRWCSDVAKISVGNQVIAAIPRLQHKTIIFCTGERRAESPARSKYLEIDQHATYTHSRRVIHWRPVIDWSDQQVWQILEQHSIQPHPCYELGYSRCSCQLCIFSSANIWATTAEIAPGKVERLKEIEQDINFTMYSGQSMGNKIAQGVSLYTAQLAYWKEQALGTFTAPLIVDTWHLPLGAKNKERAGAA